jgi:NAD(P)-dependent dehydrogenase (short-subunit alcohol dehydrogenase family)
MAALSGKIALIHGAGREPARALALALAAQGASLALCDLTPMAVEQTAASAEALGARVTCHIADPSKGLAARMLLDEVLEAWGGLDILVLHPRAEPRQPLLTLDEWDWQRTLESNLNAPFLLLQLVSGWQIGESRGGTVINLITSGSTPPENPEGAAYFTSQMALRAFTQAAAGEFAAHGIRIFGLAVDVLRPADVAEAARLAAGLCQANNPAVPGTIFELDQMRG